jgi:hypothetical protein
LCILKIPVSWWRQLRWLFPVRTIIGAAREDIVFNLPPIAGAKELCRRAGGSHPRAVHRNVTFAT